VSRRTVAAGVAVVAAGAAAVVVGIRADEPSAPAATALPPATAQVTRQTMVDTDTVSGDLGYGATTTLAGRIPGVLTRVPQAGDVIGRGQAIYRVDDTPVLLMFGGVAAYRMIGSGVAGRDVRQLETNLAAVGYGGFTVDDRFTAATANAVRRWQRDHGLPRTGRIEAGRVVFAPAAIRIDSVAAGVSQSTGGGQEVLRYTGTGRQVTAELEVSRQRLARVGGAVRVRMPDGRTVAGRVTRVHTVVRPPSVPDGRPETSLETVIALADRNAAAGIEAAVVDVEFTAAERRDVLCVPVAALVALAGGGYGVEVVDGGATHYVRVDTGLFAGGRVEISGAGIRAGRTVGMPR